MGFLTLGEDVSLTPFPALGTPSFLLGCLVQPQCEGFCLVFLYFFLLLCVAVIYWFLGGSFLKRKQMGSGSGVGVRSGWWGAGRTGGRGNCGLDISYENLFSIKKRK